MFNLSGSEIIVILILALVVLGPDKLPDAMRKAGRTFAELKKLSSGFQDEVRKGFDEPSKEIKKTAAAVRSAASFTGADTTGVKDKPRYNPAVDAPPVLPEGSSVAEPMTPSPTVEVNGASEVDEASEVSEVDGASEVDGETETSDVTVATDVDLAESPPVDVVVAEAEAGTDETDEPAVGEPAGATTVTGVDRAP